MLDLNNLITEKRNPDTWELDEMTPFEIARIMNREDQKVVEGVQRVLPEVARAIEWVRDTFERGGRLIYLGAGTSGRLGVLDSVECPPTFGVSPDQVIGLMAGGEKAFVKAVEGAEDSPGLAVEDLKKIRLDKQDILVGIAASGRTPYVIGGLKYARRIGCPTVAVACNKGSEIGKEADLAIEPMVGPEILTGSTRLKAGTAQKMILNMISTGAMVGIGKVYENLMVDVVQTNEKLCVRARNIMMMATECGPDEAQKLLEEAEGNAKTAIVMKLLDCSAEEASDKLKRSHGHIRRCL